MKVSKEETSLPETDQKEKSIDIMKKKRDKALKRTGGGES